MLGRIGIHDRNSLTIDSITSGSTHIEGSISVSDPEDVDTLSENLQNSLNDNPTVAGAGVISSSVSSSSFDSENRSAEE